MDQRSCLQGLARRLLSHLRRRQLAQLLIDERQKFVGRVGIAGVNALEDDGQFAHARIDTDFGDRLEAKSVSVDSYRAAVSAFSAVDSDLKAQSRAHTR